MKKYFLLIATFLLFSSCSKERLNQQNDSLFINNLETTSLLIVNEDSISKMNSGEFLESTSDQREIDSIVKIGILDKITSQEAVNEFISEYTDWSGYIHLQINSQTVGPANLPSTQCSVSDDFVLVGGGAYAWGWTSEGGFLTESRPNETLDAWIGSSKSHIIPDPHYLTVYSIGLRIEGVSEEYLRSKIHLYTNTSPVMNHPSTTVLIPTNCFLIGGGARDNYGGGVGNMLVYSRPGGRTSWLVEGKDHRRPCPCTITAYAIGIEDISYPTVGNIEVDYITQQDEGVKHGEGFVYSRVLPGWALTCCGGKTDYNGAGRMLIGIYPIPDTDAQTVSKDHTWYDFGFTYSFASMIRKAI